MIRSKLSISSRSRLFIFVGSLVWGMPAFAQELAAGLQAHGFISQSVTHSSDNRVGGKSDEDLAWGLREMGANLSWRPSPDWLISGQALARWAGKSDEGELRLDYGFVDRTLLADGDDQVGLRLGKIKNPIGFFNTTRDVAHTRPGIIMPQSIYMERIRDFFLAAPGISLYGNSSIQAGNLSWQLSALRPEVGGEEFERVFMLLNRLGHFVGENSWLSQITLDSVDGGWRGGVSLGEFRMGYKPGGPPGPNPFTQDLLGGNHRLPIWVMSLERNAEDWSLTAEYSQTGVKARDYGLSLEDNTTEAWYVQATRRMPEGWRAYLRYDVFYLDKDDKDGSSFGHPLGLPDHSRFAKDWVLGVRRDLDRLALSAEVHYVDGTAWLTQMDNSAAALTRKWNLFLLQAAWRY